MTYHVLPQCIAPYLVLASTHLGVAIVIEAALVFLGVGVPPPTPTWGNMLADSIRLDIMEGNIRRVQQHLDRHGIANRPHIKTHKVPALGTLQMRAGAVGITCQKLGEV